MNFTSALENWWLNRIRLVKAGKTVSPVTIRGILYLMRRQVGIRNMPKTKSGFYSGLAKTEQKFKVPREKLRIVTEPKVNLITRRGEKPILTATPSDFKNSCALIYVEKSTIITAIEEDKSFTDRGINIVKAMGFSPREVTKMIKEAQRMGVPILTLTDYDPSGILIDLKIADAGVKTARLGVDPELVTALNLHVNDVKEELPRAKNKLSHYKYLKTHYPKLAQGFEAIGTKLKPCRIEIDGVFAIAGKDNFMREILKRADRVVPVKPVQKAVSYQHVPDKIAKLRAETYNMVENLFAKISAEAEKQHSNIQKSFNDVRISQVEQRIKEDIDRADTGQAARVLEETIAKLQQLLKEEK